MRAYWVGFVVCGAAPALVCRVLLHRTGSRDPVRSQRIGSWALTVLLALNLAADMVHFLVAPDATRLFVLRVKYMVPFVFFLLVLVNGSHGLGFTCKFALVALMLTDCIVGMISCHDPELDPWLICTIGVVVLGAATTHTAELYLRRSYAEKVKPMQRRCRAGRRR